MSWCPKCRSEYVSGRETCADCGCALVESLEDISGDAGEMFDFDALSDEMKRRVLNEVNKQKLDPGILLNKPAAAGTPEYIARIIQEENAPSYEEYMQEMQQETEEIPQAFVRKEERFREYRSTGYTFLIVGLLGLLFILSELTGFTAFFNFSGGSRYVAATVMTAMFVIFIFVGISSFRSGRKLKAEAVDENTYIAALEEWIADNISIETIDDGIDPSPDIDELYQKRSEKIRSALLSHDENMNKSMLEHYVESIYSSLFEGNGSL